MNKNTVIWLVLAGMILGGCSASRHMASAEKQARQHLTDPNATRETAALYYNLQRLAGTKVLFGQQDATASGYGWNDTSGRCDIRETCGANPAFYAWDFMDFTRPNTDNTASENKIRRLTIEAYNRGGVNSYCWHFWNPITNGSFYDTMQVVRHLLPGGSHHQVYTEKLKGIARYAASLKGRNGELIPVIFRPFHEFDGNWFWWGRKFCTPEEFKQLYRFTVQYLRDTLHVRNFLYAFSPDCKYRTESQYLERYPGDGYVDIIGTDNYWNFRQDGGNLDSVYLKLKIISDYAAKTHKIAALTETGQVRVTDSLWFTHKLLQVIKNYPDPPRLAYVAVWRNNRQDYWTPPAGHPALQDFLRFTRDPFVVLEDRIPNMYIFSQHAH